MTEDFSCFIDTNIWVELIDKESTGHVKAMAIFNGLEARSAELYICPLVLSECLHIVFRICKLKHISGVKKELATVVKRIFEFPTLNLIPEPVEEETYLQMSEFMDKFRVGSNDALILSLILDHEIKYLSTFDKQLVKAARRLGIVVIN